MGLIVDVMGRDCTAGGVTEGKADAVLVGVEGPFEPRESAPALVLEEHDPARTGPGYVMVKKNAGGISRVRAVPYVDGKPKLGGMFGGHFIWTSDSRFPYTAPIPVFDRFEF